MTSVTIKFKDSSVPGKTRVLESGRGAYNVIEDFNNRRYVVTLFEFMQGVICRLGELRKYRTAETYYTALNSFKRFRENEDVLLSDITSDLMMDYEVFLKSRQITMNTISFYMRILRAVYNRAVERELVAQGFPFKYVYTGIAKTVKRALPLDSIKQIKSIDLSKKPFLELARDMFMFSFYTRGMSFIDMAYLQKKELNNGVLSYYRRKTGQFMYIKWEPCMQELVDKYSRKDSPLLLPIIKRWEGDVHRQYRNALIINNKRLKEVGQKVHLPLPLTMYVARHSWASIARSNHIPLSVISEGMGHDNESTTQIYLASLDMAMVDNANHTILNLL